MIQQSEPAVGDVGAASARSATWVRRRLVVVTDDPARAQPAAVALRTVGFPKPEVVPYAEQIRENEARSTVSIIPTRGITAAVQASRSVRARVLAAAILLLAAVDGPTALDAQADHWWAPQWGVQRMGEAVRRWVRPGAVYVADGKVYLYDRELELHGTPLLLACFLVDRAQDHCDLPSGPSVSGPLPVVTREEVKRPVWGQEVVTDHTVDQTAYRIRKALGEVDGAERSRLRSVAGRGYWFNVM